MRISDWSSDVCSSDLLGRVHSRRAKLAHDHSRPHRFKARIVHNNTFWPRPLTRNAPCGAEQPPATSAPALSSKLAVDQRLARRSEERRVGKECVRTCRSRWSPYHYKNNKHNDIINTG